MEPLQVPGYRLGERLGFGSHAQVWRAQRVADGRLVALKVVPLAADGEDADQAVREFAVLQRLRVDGLVRCHDAVLLPEAGSLALVLDLVEAGSLASVVAARGHLSVGEAVTVVAPVARTLAGLHAAGVVHADLAPDNVLLERRGRPVLGDLGVARLRGEAPGAVFGTAGFIAPEVEFGAMPTSASDVYAVGALAWWCVAGAAPAAAPLRRPLEDLVPGLPSAWVHAVEACLAPDPRSRPSAAEAALLFFDAAPCEPLRLVVGHDEVALLTRRIRTAGPPVGSEAVPSRPRPSMPRRGVLVVACVAAAGMLVAGAVAAAQGAGSSGEAGGRHRAQGAAARPVPSPGPSLVPSRVPSLSQPPVALASSPPPRTGHDVRGDVRRDSSAPRRDPAGLMQALAEERARVMVVGDPARLGSLDLPGSSAWRADAALLQRAAAVGQRYESVLLSVRSARALRARADAATLAAVVETVGYTVVTGDGRRSRPAREPGQELLFELRWASGAWLIEAVRSLPG